MNKEKEIIFDKIPTIKWWQHIFLWFLPTYYSVDCDNNKNCYYLKYKRWNDKYYILNGKYK